MRESEYETLLKDKALRWYDNVARGSVATAYVYMRRSGHFYNELSISPSKLLAM